MIEFWEDEEYSESMSMRLTPLSRASSMLAYSSINSLAFSFDLGLILLLRSLAVVFPAEG
ncbi:hypothetical protein Sjap_019513 [Stephania japonica]|uniref:Uncharacterized protein n=1 Tax=Stephania japonica TaxID=461633 RepID=A0AAP0EZK8_9MAGN